MTTSAPSTGIGRDGPLCAAAMARWRIVIHGGAGSIRPGRLPPRQEEYARAGLERALEAGSSILEKRESAIDAVETAVRILEEDECFNAGRGSVLTAEGCIELDAAIMDGRNRAAGAVSSSMQPSRSEEHTSELQSHVNIVCRLLLEKKKNMNMD